MRVGAAQDARAGARVCRPVHGKLEGRQLRLLGELPRDRTIVTYCMTGGRAGKARDILERNGFKVVNGGGYETVRKIAMRQERS